MVFAKAPVVFAIGALKIRLINVADLVCTLNVPGGVRGVAAFAQLLEEGSLRIPGDGDLVSLVGFQVQLDAAAGQGLGEGVTAVGGSYGDVPFAILGTGLVSGPSSEEIVALRGTAALVLLEGHGFGTGDEVVCFGGDGDGACFDAGTAGGCGSGDADH